MNRSILLLICFSFALLSHSQENYCQFEENYSKLLKNSKFQEYLNSRNSKSLASNKTETVFIIPVVFHVIYNQNNPAQNISDAQVISQLDALNRDFRKRNDDTTNVESGFSFTDTKIEFCLAKRDTNGNLTSGITRTSTTFTSIGVNNQYYVIRPAWDADNYLNIWVGNFGAIGQNEPIGVATPPGNPDKQKDGVLIDYEAFGTIGTANSPYNLGRTTVHEVGHWLGLFHPWGITANNCLDDDGISDTPNQENIYYFCPSPPRSSCNSKDMLSNYMGYVNDACMGNFTTGQKEKMRTTIVQQKTSFILTKSCATVGIKEAQSLLNNIQLFPNPVNEQLNIIIPDELNKNNIIVKLYSMEGKQIALKCSSNFLPTIDLKEGIYLLRINYLGQQTTKRIIVQH